MTACVRRHARHGKGRGSADLALFVNQPRSARDSPDVWHSSAMAAPAKQPALSEKDLRCAIEVSRRLAGRLDEKS